MRVPLLFILLLPITSAGCLTAAVWDNAAQPELSSPAVLGTLQDDGTSRVVVRYHTGGMFGGERHYRLPVDADGYLTGPLIYRGNGRTAEAIDADLSSEQRAAIERHRFARADRLSQQQVMQIRPPDRPIGGELELYIKSIDCYAVALDAQNQPIALTRHGPKERPSLQLADDARIVLLPYAQDRTPANEAGVVAGSAVLTPLTLASDLTVVPSLVIWILLMGLPC